MAHLSIKETMKFSFSTYGKHFVLLLSVALVMAGAVWISRVVPRFIATSLGADQIMGGDAAAVGLPAGKMTDEGEVVLKKVEELTGRLTAVPKHHLALILLLQLVCWGLCLFLMLGCLRVGLSLNDTGSGSVGLLFQTSFHQFMRFVGASFLYVLYMIAGFIVFCIQATALGLLLKNIALRFVQQTPGLFLISLSLLWLLLLAMLWYWVQRYAFYGYFIVENRASGAWDALHRSKVATRGSRIRIFFALLIFILIAAVVSFAARQLVSLAGPLYVEDLTRLLVVLFLVPLSIPFFSHLYRKLSPKKHA